MIRPFADIQPGDALSAAELNRANAEHERNAVSEVVAPLEQSWGSTGRVIRQNTRPDIWVKITGKKLCSDDPDNCTIGSGDGSTCGFCGSGDPCVFPKFHYSGIEQFGDQCAKGEDINGGMRFYVDTYPLKEIGGNENVPTDSIVRAYPSPNGPYYEFTYAAPQTILAVICNSVGGDCPTACSVENGDDPGVGFKEVKYIGCGKYAVKPGGLQQPCGAYEIHCAATDEGTVVELHPTDKTGEYWYSDCCGSSFCPVDCGTPVPTPCCPDNTIPSKLCGSITTGCMSFTFELEYTSVVTIPGSPTATGWQSPPINETQGMFTAHGVGIVVWCDNGTWRVHGDLFGGVSGPDGNGRYTCGVSTSGAAASATCDPLSLVWNCGEETPLFLCSGAIFPACCCTDGTLTITACA